MSYRLRLGKIEKELKIQYNGKSYEDVLKEFGDDDPDNFIFASIEGFEEIEYIPDLPYPSSSEWARFYSFDLKEYGYEFSILSKENLKEIINLITKEISKMYNSLHIDLHNGCGGSAIGRIASMIMSKRNDWDTEFVSPLVWDENNLCVTNLGSYEYMVFNLISIYKHFNWEDDYLVFSGW